MQVNGAAFDIAIGASDQLAAGTVKRLSANLYQVIWNTGETLLVTDTGASLDAGCFGEGRTTPPTQSLGSSDPTTDKPTTLRYLTEPF